MTDKPDSLDYLTEIPSGSWIVRDKPKGRAVGIVELVPATEGFIHTVTTWHENPDYTKHFGYRKFFRDACKLAWVEGQRQTPPVEHTKWTEEMVRGHRNKRG